MKTFDKYKALVIASICISIISLLIVLFKETNLGARTENVWRQYSSNAYFGNNVGINTTDPNQKLTLNQGNIATEIQVPTISAASTTLSGPISTSTYYFKLVVIDGANGTSTASSEVSSSVTATTSGVNLTWTAVNGAYKYLIFWATSTGAQTQYFTATATNAYTFSTTTGATVGTLPTTNTAYANKISYTGNSWIKNNFGVGTSSPSAMLSVGNTGTTTIEFGKFCIKSADIAGTNLYIYLTTNGVWATSSSSCF